MKQVYPLFYRRIHLVGLMLALLVINLHQARGQCTAPTCTTGGPGSFTSFGCGLAISGAISTFLGQVLSCGGSTNLNSGGAWTINGSLEIRSGNTIIVNSGASLYVYGSVYNAGSIIVNSGGSLYFYGDQWINDASASVTGSGTIYFKNPRPAPNATADGATRPNGADNGFPASSMFSQCLDGGSITMQPNLNLANDDDVVLSELTYTSAAGGSFAIAAGSNNAGFSNQVAFGIDNTHLWLGNNTLNMTSTGTFDLCGPQRYVVTNGTGTLTKQSLNAGQFTFPIGACAPSDYTPARITDNVAGANDYAMRVQNSISTPSAVPDVTATAEGPQRYWNINTTSTNMDVALQHNTTTEGTSFAANSGIHYITRNVGAPSGSGATESIVNWDRTGTGITEPVGTLQCGGGTVSGSTVLSRTVNTGTLSTWYSKSFDSNTPLPIELLDFTATALDNTKALLKWKTATETNNAYFSIQRSRDGLKWSEIGQKKGKNNSSTIQSYTHIDVAPLQGINYYRLEQFDLDGKSSFSPIRAVAINGKGFASIIYPNPTTDKLQVQLAGNDQMLYQLEVYNTVGQQVLLPISGVQVGALQALPTDELPAGTYFLRISTTSGTIMQLQTFIKQY